MQRVSETYNILQILYDMIPYNITILAAVDVAPVHHYVVFVDGNHYESLVHVSIPGSTIGIGDLIPCGEKLKHVKAKRKSGNSRRSKSRVGILLDSFNNIAQEYPTILRCKRKVSLSDFDVCMTLFI